MTTTPPVFDMPPPPYSGPNSVFALPSYEITTSLDIWADSYCLPPYQSRTGMRFHPYLRILPIRRVQHTESFEEFYRSLQAPTDHRVIAPPVAEAPSVVATPTPSCPLAPSMNRQAVPAPPFIAPPGPPPLLRLLVQDPGPGPAERRQSLLRRLFFLPEIIKIVRTGLGAAIRAAEARFLTSEDLKRKMILAAQQKKP